jgi:hypothetical protein
MDLPAEVFLDIVHHVYQEHTLVKRKFWSAMGHRRFGRFAPRP